MSEKQLAIVSVAIQEWGQIYDDKNALDIGTIFHELNKPFFAASTVNGQRDGKVPEEEKRTEEQKQREEMLLAICRVGFVLDDLTLYLDTHEEDEKAKNLYKLKLQESEELHKKFAEKFYPLTRPCIPYCYETVNDRFCWQKGPMPWEGACV